MRKSLISYLPDFFGRRRIFELECELEEAQGHIEELQAEADVVSVEFEKDCWRSMRRLLERCKFDWRDVGHDGVSADAAEDFIRETIDDLDARLARALTSQDEPMRKAARKLYGLVKDIDLGRSIHNDRHPDRPIEGGLWTQLMKAAYEVDEILSASTPPVNAMGNKTGGERI
jgi:hypothetical protein